MGNRQPGGGRPASCLPGGERRVRSVCERYRGQRACDKGAGAPGSRGESIRRLRPRQSPRATRSSDWLQESSSQKTLYSLLLYRSQGLRMKAVSYSLIPNPYSLLLTLQIRAPQFDPIQAAQQGDGDASRVK